MNCERAGELFFERVEGRLDLLESRALDEHIGGCARCREELHGLVEVWDELGRLGEERAGADMRERFYAMLAVHENGKRSPIARRRPAERRRAWWPRQPALQAGVALATLLVGMWLGPRLGFGGGGHGEVDQLRVEMKTMARAVTLSLLEHQSASERLRAVSLSETAGDDDAVTAALLRVIGTDSSVNVRLAALDVLARLVERPEVRSGLLQSFPEQRSPTMQVAMADVLAAMNGPRSEEAIREALRNERLPREVRDYLEQKLTPEGDEI